MRRLLPLLAFALVLASCGGNGSGDPSSPADSGIRGTVTTGPQCPVVLEGSPCPDAPWIGTLSVTGGGADLQVDTDQDGRFEIAVEPGTYEVQPLLDGPASSAAQVVTVGEHEYVEVTFTVDSGIR